MSFKEKYLKYKRKYIALKNQLGGVILKRANIIGNKEMFNLFDKYKNIKNKGLKAVVLYGSVARNQANAGSDIDFLLFWDKKEDEYDNNILNKTNDIAKELKRIYNKNIELVSIKYNESTHIHDTTENYNFITEVCSNGIVVYGNVLSMNSGDSCELYKFKYKIK